MTTQQPDTTKQNLNRFALLDPLRGLSCLAIIIFHATVASIRVEQETPSHLPLSRLLVSLDYLSLGVPFFFVISGYCISASWERFALKGKPFEFFYRRFIRIFPPFWICWSLTGFALIILKVTGLLHYANGPESVAVTPFDLTFSQFLGNLTLTETWRPFLLPDSPSQMNVLGQMWTLCYEEQFYLLCFALLFLDKRLFFPLLTALAIFIFASTTQFRSERIPFLNSLVNLVGSKHFLFYGTFLDTYFLDFYCGVAAYFSIRSQSTTGKLLPVGIVCLFLFFFFAEFRLGTRESLLIHIAAILFSLLLIALHPVDNLVANNRFLSPLKWCGKRCYSLYLTHGLPVTLISSLLLHFGFTSPTMVIFIFAPLSVFISLIIGDLFFRFIESRFLSTAPFLDTRLTASQNDTIRVRS